MRSCCYKMASMGVAGMKMDDVRKELFRSPAIPNDRMSGNADKVVEGNKALMNQLQIEQAVQISLRSVQRDMHEQRLKQLRGMVNTLSEDDWRYTPIEKLMGLQ